PIGTKVAAEGVVTVGTGPFGTRVFYVQDASSGIMAFFNPSGTAVTVNLGASIRVVGTVNQFGGELEIDSVAVSVLGTGTVPTPRALSGAQINARTFEGELARVSDAEIISVPGGTGASFNVAARDLAGTDFTIRVAGAGTGLTRSSFVVGRRYNATGILGSFSGVAQLKPRATTDLEAASAAISIAEVKARPIGTKVTAEGVVTVGTGPFGTRVFYLQDASGGIMAFFNPSGTAVTVDLGARVRAAGTVNQFGGELEIDSVAVTVLGTATVPTPRTVTAAQMIARTFEGELAKLENATVTSVPGGTGSSFNVTVTASTGESLTVRVAGSGTGLTRSSFQVGARYDFVGILGSFSATAQLKPRSTADLIQL
ncbi:MAG: hypothetical protein HY561_10420, partial [Gemmatimonadetes bacterium]|nr:hypothetical protein [Gemmatimonadota bacterium]